MKFKINYSMTFNLVVLGFTAWLLYLAWDWPWETKLFPMIISFTIVGLSLIQLVIDIIKAKNPTSRQDESGVADLPVEQDISPEIVMRRGTIAWGWLFGFIFTIAMVGFVLSVPLFVLTYMLIQGREKPWVAISWSLITFTFTVVIFDLIVHTRWPMPFWEAPEDFVIRFIHRYITSGA
jgi:hypothetical protein